MSISIFEGAEGSCFEDLVKKREELFMEIGKDGLPIEITYPINEKTHLIEYDNRDKYSMTACAWITLRLLDRGCRIFSSKNSFFVNTSMSKQELIAVIDELMPKLANDNEFWDMIKCYEEYQSSTWS